MTNLTSKFCTSCGASLPPQARFCAQCGMNLDRVAKHPISVKHLFLVALTALVLWGFSWSLGTGLAGTKPTAAFQGDASGAEAEYHDPVVDNLRGNLKAAPKDMKALESLAEALLAKIRGNENPPSNLVFESIEVLGEILKLDPKHKEALISMADLSFSQQAFPKALEFYKRYLELAPDDLSAKAKYASSLTFVGNFKEAIKELDYVISKDPKNFHALAYLSITYAQMGDKTKALQAGEKALTLAPDEEAKKRFLNFIDSLKAQPQTGEVLSDEQSIVQAIRNNPVAGPKFVDFKRQSEDTLVLYLKDFPMQAMPPFAKEKFFSGLKASVPVGAQSKIKTIVFADKESGQVMDKLELAENVEK